ncbi:MAG: preprotein translocase subunit YajC [Nevskiaceae bacterium]
MSFLPLIILIVLFWFMLIRPQMKRSKEMREMLGKLAKGDEVITSGGLAGVVRDIGENYLTVEIADNVAVKMQKSAVVSVLPKGSLKTL